MCAVELSGKTSADEDGAQSGIHEVRDFHGADADLLRPSWFGNWSFTEGIPREGWKSERLGSIPFELDGCINLDGLCRQVPGEKGSEGVVYVDYIVQEEGVAILGIGCNWCFEAYCDGCRIHSTYPNGNGSEYVFATNHRIFFRVTKGKHLLAIRVRRGEKNWDFACSAWIGAQPPEEPKIVYGPWLCNPDVGRMTVGFLCNTPTGVGVQFRRSGEEAWQTKWHQRQGQCLRRTYHAVELDDLAPGCKYEYRIIGIHPDSFLETVLCDVHSFTVPDAQRSSYSFFITADLQYPLDVQRKYLDKMLKASKAVECDFFVLNGDVNSRFLPEEVIGGPFAQLCDFGASSRPIIYLRGNHELRGDAGDRFLDYFALNNGRTYDVIRIGDTAFLFLDSWEDKPAKTPGHTYCQWNLDEVFRSEEAAWLKKALEDPKWSEAKRRIVICHGAAYSHFDSCHHLPYVLAEMTDPYFGGVKPACKLNMWLAGHVHRYMRSIPGTTTIVAEIEPPIPLINGKGYSYPVLTVAGPKRGVKSIASCFRVDADAEGFRVRSWNQEGEMLEDVRYENDGRVSETKSLPHFTLPE